MGKLHREIKMSIHNRFDIEVVDVETGEIKQKAQAFNVVCNSYYDFMWDSWQSGSGGSVTIVVGKGTGTPNVNDTSLFTFIGAASTTDGDDFVNFAGEDQGLWYRQIKRTIPNTLYVDETITEVGLSKDENNGRLLTHAMLQDMNGNTISIAHTATDIINIYCTIYLHYAGQNSGVRLFTTGRMNVGDVQSSLVYCCIGNMLLRPANWRGSVYLGKDTTSNTYGNVGTFTHPSAKTVVFNATQIPVATGNIAGIGALVIRSDRTSEYNKAVLITTGQNSFSPISITGESVGVGDGTTTRFHTKFDKPYNAVVKVNGVAVTSGVQVNKLPARSITANDRSASLNNGSYLRNVKEDNVSIPALRYEQDTVYGGVWAVECLVPEIGLYRINSADNGRIQGSNDGVTWVAVETNTSNVQMNQAGAHYKYYRSTLATASYVCLLNAYDGNNIVFDTPPAQGDVITIDYTTDYIPKDEDHVLDVELTFTFGEYTGN